jgi:hypothetical protein
MPLTAKGSEVMAKLKKEYGPESGERVFYAMKNKGTLTGVDSRGDAAEPGTPEDQTPIPADYGTKLDRAADAADKLMVRLGSYMDRNDGQMCNIADSKRADGPMDLNKLGKDIGKARSEKLAAASGKDYRVFAKYKSGKEKDFGNEWFDESTARRKMQMWEGLNPQLKFEVRKTRGDSDTEAERSGVEIHGKREMVR